MASSTDLLQEVGTPGTATTLASPGYTIGATSIVVASTANWPTATGTTFAIDRSENVGGVERRIEGTYCEFVGVVSSATSITSVSKVFGTAQDYPAGSTTRVYIPVSSERENRLVEWGLVHANQNGTLKDNSVGAAQISSGAVGESELATGSVATTKVIDAAITPPKWTNPYKFHAYRNGAWTGESGKINLDAEVFDSNNNFDITTNYRYTAPVNGFYQISFCASSAQNNGTGYGAYIRKNGTTSVISGSFQIAAFTNGFNVRSSGSGIIQLAAGDYLELMYVGGGSVAGTTGSDATYMGGHLVSET